MRGRRRIIASLGVVLLALASWAGLNFLTDPFGVFGDVIFGWDAYSQTLNPRNGKAVYVSNRFSQYDSYIIGSSAASAYLPEELNGYLDASFYNLSHPGADTGYDRALVSYLLEHDQVKYIFLALGLEEADGAAGGQPAQRGYYKVTGETPLSYYARHLFAGPSHALDKLRAHRQDTPLAQSFDLFLPESGCYDRRVQDVEPIGALSLYQEKNGASFPVPQGAAELQGIESCVSDVAEIKKMCDEAGVQLMVVLSPSCEAQLLGYTAETLDRYFTRLAQVVDYWNFSISPLTYDPRYFYDASHPRAAACSMALARMFGGGEAYYPDSFGALYQEGAAPSVHALEAEARAALKTPYAQAVPILLYHHLALEGAESATMLYPETFERQMALLSGNGYTAVSFDDLIAFVERGAALPERPVVITFDDGYYSNYQLAFPILQKYGHSATIFAIGSSIGHMENYKDTEHPITPHFGQAEIEEMTSSGLVSIHSHTYDMHQWPPFETGDAVRENILPLEGEGEAAYIAALSGDVARQDERFAQNGLEKSCVLAFPGGRYTALTDVVLRSCGYKVTLTTDAGRVNTLVRGLPQSLVNLGRMNIGEATTDEQILEYLSRGQS